MKRSPMPPRRKPLRASTPKLDKAGRPKSRRTSKAERQFRHDVLARDVMCHLWAEGVGECSNGSVAVHAHHLAGRVGPDAHHADNGIGVCWVHHAYIHAHPAESYGRGWMKHRNHVDGAA